jgi:hypothetical protein
MAAAPTAHARRNHSSCSLDAIGATLHPAGSAPDDGERRHRE